MAREGLWGGGTTTGSFIGGVGFRSSIVPVGSQLRPELGFCSHCVSYFYESFPESAWPWLLKGD